MPSKKLVHIDLENFKATILASLPHDADRKRILKGVGAAAAHYWKKLAQQELRSTARDYVQGIKHTATDEKATVSLEGQLPNMIEKGWSGGDMREWMLSSPKAKKGKDGPYLVVPFRHGTPGTGGRNVGNVMPGPIHAAAKRLLPTLSRPGEAVSQASGTTKVHGTRLHPNLPMKEAARQILQRKEKPHHATSIYMGMIRNAQPTKKGLRTSGYHTFRTISTHTRAAGKHWVHPGIKARNLARKVTKHLEKLAGDIVRSSTK